MLFLSDVTIPLLKKRGFNLTLWLFIGVSNLTWEWLLLGRTSMFQRGIFLYLSKEEKRLGDIYNFIHFFLKLQDV